VQPIATALATARRGAAPVSLLAVALVVLAGCGSSSKTTSSSAETSASSAPATTPATPATTSSTPSSAASGASTTLSLEANKSGQLKYNKTSLTAKAGSVTIDFTNMAELAHNVNVESSSGTKEGGTETFTGGSKPLTLNLKPGTYKFFCSVPGHRMAGMEGTLTVQ
jgi:plastocyanin